MFGRRCEVAIIGPDFGKSRLLRCNQMDDMAGSNVDRCGQPGGKQLGPDQQVFCHRQQRPNAVSYVVPKVTSYRLSLVSV